MFLSIEWATQQNFIDQRRYGTHLWNPINIFFHFSLLKSLLTKKKKEIVLEKKQNGEKQYISRNKQKQQHS